ncbi:hypothetical protein H0W80_02885 [Candidatus Saccharibacteria bacterium]|nr:hypothetical protein [Candidatus Saccharibacteria bacterium]
MFFKDRSGTIVLAQVPNVPIIIAIIVWLLMLFVHQEPYQIILTIVFNVALGIWAVLEFGWGVNYFRRGLGLVVLIFVLKFFTQLLLH